MLLIILNILLTAVAGILLIPTAVFCFECLAALLPGRRPAQPALGSPRPRVAILMPAHNEEFGIDPAIHSVLPQLKEGDRILVVADNCSDATAAVARAAGVEVVERNDPDQRGKGYALDFGLTHLESNAPDVVIILDSDCVLHDGSIEALARQVEATNRPAQAIYLLASPKNSHSRDAVSSLAFLVKNLVRPRGLDRLGLPCLLTGAGMALPWQQVRASRMATGNIVEDLQLGIDLTLAGYAPRLCTGAFVTGELPGQRHAAIGQRRRWEHGYLQTAIRTVPELIVHGLRSLSINQLGIAFELSVPPLALLVMSLTLATSITTSATLLGASHRVPLILAIALFITLFCIAASWFRFGRSRVPATALLGCPSYLLGKLPLYAGFAFKRETQWIRTARAGEAENRDTKSGSAIQNAQSLPSIVLQGVRFTCVTQQQCVEHLMQELDANRGGELVTPNLDHLRRCRLDPSFAGLVAQSQVVVADGMPLVWASRLQGTPLPERVAGSDLISSVSAAAAERGRSVFFLGGAPGSAQAAAEVLVSRHPTLKIAGTHCPPMGFELNPEAMAEIIDRLTMAKPDIVYVALGSPKQEHLIHELREWLPRSWWLGVGYSFSFLAGEGSRAPLWMQRTGLEWLHRLAREPRRLARRYLLEGLPHAARLLTSTTFNGITGRHAAATPAAPKASQSLPQQHRTGNNPDRQELEALIYSSFTRGLGVELERPPRQIAKAHRPRHRTDAGTGRISAFVLLGGTLRPSPFLTAVRRSILDMPIQDGRRLLSNWQHQTSELAKAEGLADLPLRVLIDHESPVPAGSPASISGTISIERDAARYRGTGGLLRDLAEDYDDNDFLLVASGGQLLTQHLTDLVRELHETNADVSFIAHQDGTPSSVMLIRCETLRGISASGYVDLKEQALPVIARNFKVAHVEHAWPTCLPLRTHKDYLAALRWWHLHRSFQSADDMLQDTDSLLDHHSYRFSIVEHGAIVDPTACLQDCVVLRGARVGPGAVAVRSVLCAGSVLAASETAVDQLVSARSRAQTAKTQRILQLSRN